MIDDYCLCGEDCYGYKCCQPMREKKYDRSVFFVGGGICFVFLSTVVLLLNKLF